MTKKQHINAYILAGGKSSRMGTDKGLMDFGGKKIVQYVIEQVKPLVEKVVIVSNNPEYKQFGLKVIEDVIKDVGPAGGIYTALCHSKAEKNIVLSCDMPFVSQEALKSLIDQSLDWEITVPVYKQKLEPMISVYLTACKSKWEELISKKIFKLQVLYSHFKTLELNVDDNPLFHEKLFTNINTSTDLNNALTNKKPEIKLLLFGQIADILRANELVFNEAETSDELSLLLQQKFPLLKSMNYRIAVNKKIIQNTEALSNGDVVALLPPFSGG